MKNQLFNTIILLMSLSLIFSSCSSDDDGDSNQNNAEEIAQIENEIMSGTWRISSFIDSGVNETSDFTGYNFTFASNGSLTADNGTTTLVGTWSIEDDSDDDSDSDNDIDFNISFPVSDASVFEDLNDDWDIISHSSTRVSLLDISEGNGGTDTLIFDKN